MPARYWVGGSGSWGETAHWAATSGGIGGASVPTSSDDVYIDNNSGSDTVYIGVGSTTRVARGLYLSRTTLTYISESSTSSVRGGTLNTYGNIAYASSAAEFRVELQTWGVYGTITLDLNSADVQVPRIYAMSIRGNATIVSDFAVSNAYVYGTLNMGGAYSIYGLRLSQGGGVFNTNNYDISFGTNGIFTLVAGTTINLGTSTVTFGSFGPRSYGFGDGISSFWAGTLNAQNAHLILYTGVQTTALSDPARYNFGGRSIGAITVKRTSSYYRSITLDGSNTIGTMTIEPGVTAYFGAGSTQSLGGFIASGTSSNQIAVRSSTSGSHFTLSKTSGTVDAYYLDVKDSAATGGATWNANSSVDSGNNTGWNFIGPVSPTANFTGSPTSGRAPLTVSFTDTSLGEPTSWLWDFGDGTTSTAQNPTKTYTAVGTYTVQLFASNTLGGDTKTRFGYITAEATILTPDGIGGAEAFGDLTVEPGAITCQLDGVPSSEAFGDLQFNATTPPLDGIATSEAFGDITVITGRKNVFPDSIVTAEAFGDVGISVGPVTQPLDGVQSAEAFGGLTIVPGPISVGTFDSIASAEAFGTDLAIAQSPPPPPPPIDWSVIGKEDQKSYLYKVYKSDGTFIGIWNDVKDDPQFTQRLYEPGTTMTTLLSRSPNTTKEKLDNLVTQGSEQITDEGGVPLLVSYATNNSVGEGTDVELNYRVDVYVIYGGFEPLTTQSGEPITTEDGEEILVAYGAPNGVRIFSGIILDYELVFGDQTGVTVTLASHGKELTEKLLMDGTKTTVTYSSMALETQAKNVLDADPGVMTYSADSISATGVSRTLKFQLNTKLEAIKSIFNQTPDGWYWYGDVAENYIYMKPKSTVPQHIFWVGYHIKSFKLKRSIEQLRNKVYFVAGDSGGTTIYKKYEDVASQTAWRKSVYRITDRRYTNTTSMQARADKEMSRFKGPIYASPIEISSAKYDLERVKLGQMVSIRGSQNAEVDALLLQIVGITYTPTSLKLELGDLLDTQADTVVGIESNLQNEQFEKIPDEPS